MNELKTQLEAANNVIQLKNQRINSLVETNCFLNEHLLELQQEIEELKEKLNNQSVEDKIYNVKLQISLGK